MARKTRRTQQHLRQKPSRERTYRTGGTAPSEIYKPGFPMNLFMNMKVFVAVGLFIMVGGIVVAALVAGTGNANPSVDTPDITPTATVGDGSPTPTATPDPRRFTAAQDVTDPATTDYSATITTDKGVIEIDLLEDVAPNAVNSFVFLARNGYFDDLRWHRVVDDFVIQGGDPYSAIGTPEDLARLVGQGGPGYTTADEPNDLSNTRGRISWAKTEGATVYGSQFFINLKDNSALDAGKGATDFYPFAEVTSGMDVADRVVQNDVIQSVVINEKRK